MAFPKAYADRVAKLRVPFGFVLVAALAWLAAPSIESILWSLPVAAAGLAIRAWAAGHLAKNQQLATGGPYAWVRNPLYIGTLLVAASLVIAARRWDLAMLFAAVFGLVYLPVIELEEQHLRSLFPQYADYARRVRKLLPGSPAAAANARFSFALYRKNEEYQALIGYLFGLALLVWKAAQN